MILRSLREREHRHPVRSPVGRGSGLVLAGIGVQHPAAAHHMGDHVEIAAEVGVAEIREDGAVAVHLLHVIGEALLADSHQEALAQVLLPLGVEQGKVDLGVLAHHVAKVPHAEVQVMGEDLLVLLAAQRAARRRALRVLGALHVLRTHPGKENCGISGTRSNVNYLTADYPSPFAPKLDLDLRSEVRPALEGAMRNFKMSTAHIQRESLSLVISARRLILSAAFSRTSSGSYRRG